MPALSANRDANGWVFVDGMTGPGSIDPVGPAATTAKLSVKGGDHYVGANLSTPSTAIFRTFFDGLAGTSMDIGYVVTVGASCFGQPIDIAEIPAFGRQRRYAVGTGILDFMGPFDARARFGNPQETDRAVDGPLYPFNAFMGSPLNDFSNVFWHPMPNGSLRRPAGGAVPPSSRPRWVPPTALPAQAASARTVVRPFLLTAPDLGEICQPAFATFDEPVAADYADAKSLYQVVHDIYAQRFVEPLSQVIDATAAGPYLILIVEDHSAIIVLKQPKVSGAYPIQIWEVDHDTFERLQHQVTNRALRDLSVMRGERLSDRFEPAVPMRGRGSRAIEAPDPLGLLTARPTFSLEYQATLVEWRQPPRTRRAPVSTPVPHSTVAVRFDWIYDPFGESFDVVVNAPHIPFAMPRIGEFWLRYQAGLAIPHADDAPDLTPFTLAGAPWLDTAPKVPTQPVTPFEG